MSDTQEFMNKIESAMKAGEVFVEIIGWDDMYRLTVNPDGSASCGEFDLIEKTLPSGSTPEQILDWFSTNIRHDAYSETNESGATITFIKDLKVGDVVLYDYGSNQSARVSSITRTDDQIEVAFVVHSPGKTWMETKNYPSECMWQFELLWGADWAPEG